MTPPRPEVPSRDDLLRLVDRFRGRKVAVIGDLVLDEYWVGRSSRISREAPVLILEHEGDRHVPGGAANAAMNVRSLGGAPLVVGRLGGDPAGIKLARALRASGLPTSWLFRDPNGGTIVKTRVLAGSSHAARQQIVRLDRGHQRTLPGHACQVDSTVASTGVRFCGLSAHEIVAHHHLRGHTTYHQCCNAIYECMAAPSIGYRLSIV